MKNDVKRQSGASLIEVMVALFVLAIGILGVVSMQAKSLQLSQNAYVYSQVSVLADSVMESMRSTPSELNVYTTGAAVKPDCSVSCSEEKIAEWNYSQWLENLQSTLPGASSEIDSTQIGSNPDIFRVDVDISFNVGFEDDGTPKQQTISFSTQI